MQGLLEFLFTLAFKGLVYPQIWEDPDVDMEALAITSDCHVVAIASGGCNVLSYLIADPARITAVDLARPHVALNRLKLAAARHLPTWQSFYRFFGEADTDANVAAYWRFLEPHLDDETRAYWEGRNLMGRRRITMCPRNVYRCGLLGHSIGLGHLLARPPVRQTSGALGDGAADGALWLWDSAGPIRSSGRRRPAHRNSAARPGR